jgi:hypothetical protein
MKASKLISGYINMGALQSTTVEGFNQMSKDGQVTEAI